MILNRKEQFLFLFSDFLDKLYDLSYNKITFNSPGLKHLADLQLIRLTKLYVLYKKVFSRESKSGFLHRKRYRKLRKVHPKKIRYIYKILFHTLGAIINLYLQYNFLHMQLRMEEFRFYIILLSAIKGKKFKGKKLSDEFYLKLEECLEEYLISNNHRSRHKIIKYYSLFFRKTLKKYRIRRYYKYVKKLKHEIPRAHTLTYFLINRHYKKLRKKRTPRLKFVH